VEIIRFNLWLHLRIIVGMMQCLPVMTVNPQHPLPPPPKFSKNCELQIPEVPLKPEYMYLSCASADCQ